MSDLGNMILWLIEHHNARDSLVCQGLNNFQSMPMLPGQSAPLNITTKSVKQTKSKAKAGKAPQDKQARGSGNVRGGDAELLQLNLKRQQIKTFQAADARLKRTKSFVQCQRSG